MDVPPKNVVTFKPGKEMEEKVRTMAALPNLRAHAEDDELVAETANGLGDRADAVGKSRAKTSRARKAP